MAKCTKLKFNIAKAVNNRYKPIRKLMHKSTKILHIVSREEYQYMAYYGDIDTLSNIIKENMIFDYIQSVDYERYERWLKNGGRY